MLLDARHVAKRVQLGALVEGVGVMKDDFGQSAAFSRRQDGKHIGPGQAAGRSSKNAREPEWSSVWMAGGVPRGQN